MSRDSAFEAVEAWLPPSAAEVETAVLIHAGGPGPVVVWRGDATPQVRQAMAQRCVELAERDVLDGVSWLWLGWKDGRVVAHVSRFPAAPEEWLILDSRLFLRQCGAVLTGRALGERLLEWRVENPHVVDDRTGLVAVPDAAKTALAQVLADHERSDLVDCFDLPLGVTWVRLWVNEGELTWLEYGATHGGALAVSVNRALRSIVEALAQRWFWR